MELKELAHSRSGDKSGSANVAVVVTNPKDFDRVRQALSPDRIRVALGLDVGQSVHIYPVESLAALNVLLPDVLGGAPTYTLAYDVFGHNLGARILALEVDDG